MVIKKNIKYKNKICSIKKFIICKAVPDLHYDNICLDSDIVDSYQEKVFNYRKKVLKEEIINLEQKLNQMDKNL